MIIDLKHYIFLPIILILVGCSSATQIPDKDDQSISDASNYQEEIIYDESSSAESTTPPDYTWIDNYISYLQNIDSFYYPYGGLIYVDDDNIPEIALVGNSHAQGSIILSIGPDNSVKECTFAENHVYYIPKGSAVLDFYIGGGGVSEGVVQLKDREWVNLFRGEFYLDDFPDSDYYKDYEGHSYMMFENGYYEEGKEINISKEEYNEQLQTALDKCGFDDSKAKNTMKDTKYTPDELIEKLEKQRQ